MKRTTLMLVGVAIFALVAVWAYSAFLDSNRFIITNAGGGAVYKTDKKTGKTTILYQGKELEVQQYVFVQPTPTPTPRQETAEETVARWEQEFLNEAVALAKEARTMAPDKSPVYTQTNEQFLNDWLKRQKGDIRVGGWSAKKVDDQTYLVTYALVRDGKGEGVRFEVNLAAQLVRNVKGDPALEQKYSAN